MSTGTVSQTEFTGVRVRVETALTVDQMAQRLRERMGRADLVELGKLARECATAEEYAREVQSRFVGESGFMLFAEFDHGAWLSRFGIRRQVLRWILGNPLIRHGIRVNAIAPGMILTNFSRHNFVDEEGNVDPREARAVPQERGPRCRRSVAPATRRRRALVPLPRLRRRRVHHRPDRTPQRRRLDALVIRLRPRPSSSATSAPDRACVLRLAGLRGVVQAEEVGRSAAVGSTGRRPR